MGSPVSEFDTGSINEVPPVVLSGISFVKTWREKKPRVNSDSGFAFL